VAGDVGYDYSELALSADKLLTLLTGVRALRARIAAMAENDSPGTWPDIPSVQEFATSYRDRLVKAETWISAIEEALDSSRTALSESARTMQEQDATVQEGLQAIAARLDRGVPVSSNRGPQMQSIS
jgi:hypothetical protein